MNSIKVRCLYDELMPIAELKKRFHPKNRNRHPPEQIKRLAKILAYQGARRAATLSNLSGRITTGHGRVLVAEFLGWESYPVHHQEYESEDQEYADLQADNAIAWWSELDLPAINADLPDLGPFDIDLLGIQNFVVDLAEIGPSSANDAEHSSSSPQPGEETPEQKQVRLAKIVIPEIREGDCMEVLKTLSENSVDALVTDPPYGWRFMGKAWDGEDIEKKAKQARRPGETYIGADGRTRKTRDDPAMAAGKYDFNLDANLSFQSWTTEWAREVYRVLKPGAHALIFCGPRTYHRMASGVEDAGFEVRDQLQWLFGSGFPKSLDISKAIDKAAGAEREVTGFSKSGSRNAETEWARNTKTFKINEGHETQNIPATLEAKLWQGFGTALKPANEPILLARKPLSEDTVAANVLKWSTGALNIDASRIGDEVRLSASASAIFGSVMKKGPEKYVSGRWPANLVLSHNPDCVEVGVKEVGSGSFKGPNARPRNNGLGLGNEAIRSGASGAPDNYGTETVPAWNCSPGCAVAMLDGQSGYLHGRQNKVVKESVDKGIFGNGIIRKNKSSIEGIDLDKGGTASRFFYCAKTSKSERNAGLEGLKETIGTQRMNASSMRFEEGREPTPRAPQSVNQNSHPTVKPTRLMAYLCRLITPPGGLILDPFCGSGSTGVAAGREGFKFLGIEKDPEYIQIARHRFVHEMELTPEELEDPEPETEGEVEGSESEDDQEPSDGKTP